MVKQDVTATDKPSRMLRETDATRTTERATHATEKASSPHPTSA